jgi:Zn-dependent protease with chaperone function
MRNLAFKFTGKRLLGLSSSEYEHPFDRQALDALEKIPGLPQLTKKVVELSLEKIARTQYAGSNLKITRENLPEVHSVLAEACAALSINRVPDLYVCWDHSINALTTGVENPFIVINSGCIDLLEPQELMFVLGHELGHIKSGHVLYRQMAELFPFIVEQIGRVTFGVAGIAGSAMQLALMNWYRMSEFTADRAGLLACQDQDVCIKTLVKMAGLPASYDFRSFHESFLKQAREFNDLDYDRVSKTVKLLSTATLSHPWTVLRASEFLKWIDAGEYETTLQGDSRGVLPIAISSRFCINCGSEILSNATFCVGCGLQIGD